MFLGKNSKLLESFLSKKNHESFLKDIFLPLPLFLLYLCNVVFIEYS